VDQWRVTRFQSDQELADTIRGDAIDILVDLTGHIAGNRLLTFARKPAPVQVTYLGYQNTTGMSAMDYRLTDAWADPPGQTDSFYTEELVRLPRAFFCYRPSEAPEISPLPALESGYVTFGSFNNFAKVSPGALEAWLNILDSVAQSRLIILAHGGGSLAARVQRQAESRGLDPARIEFCEKRPRPAYLELMTRVDIALDPFPFNGHTTTCDAVWMGLPVVMLAGASYASRFGGSVLQQVGLAHLIAESPAEYIEIAGRLAADVEALAQLRATLRDTMAGSALLDAAGFTRNLEAAYRKMWHKWCAT
jgi:predicted O-linked N-acetylglucosamine transferase (SPINDLY family)